MNYEQFLEETNLLNSKYELDRQELADRYASNIEKLSDKKDKAVAKLFEEYKKAKKEADEKLLEDNSK